jgi:ATP-dependent helicase HrpA
LAASRELDEIEAALAAVGAQASAVVARQDPDAWRRARTRWEKPPQKSWAFGDVPTEVPVSDQAGLTVQAFPGLQPEADGVALRLFRDRSQAQAETRKGLSALFESGLRYELSWLQRDLGALREVGALAATLASVDALREDAFLSIRNWTCDPERMGDAQSGLTAASFAAALDRTKADLRGLVPRFADLLKEILSLRQQLLVAPQPYEGMEKDLARLVGPDFLRATPHARLAHFPRYLKAMLFRTQRWKKDPGKDAERARKLAPYLARLRSPDAGSAAASSRRWLVEEFRVSLFAQQLGTAEPVSTVRLDEAFGPSSLAESELRKGGFRPGEPAPPRLSPLSTTKSEPIKSLGSLDKFFPR